MLLIMINILNIKIHNINIKCKYLYEIKQSYSNLISEIPQNSQPTIIISLTRPNKNKSLINDLTTTM